MVVVERPRNYPLCDTGHHRQSRNISMSKINNKFRPETPSTHAETSDFCDDFIDVAGEPDDPGQFTDGDVPHDLHLPHRQPSASSSPSVPEGDLVGNEHEQHMNVSMNAGAGQNVNLSVHKVPLVGERSPQLLVVQWSVQQAIKTLRSKLHCLFSLHLVTVHVTC